MSVSFATQENSGFAVNVGKLVPQKGESSIAFRIKRKPQKMGTLEKEENKRRKKGREKNKEGKKTGEKKKREKKGGKKRGENKHGEKKGEKKNGPRPKSLEGRLFRSRVARERPEIQGLGAHG